MRSVILAVIVVMLMNPTPAVAFGDQSKIVIGQLILDQNGPDRASAIAHLTYELAQTTAVEVSDEVVRLSPTDPDLFSYPFVLLVGSESFSMPDSPGITALSRYLSNGGFLLIDDVSGSSNSGFDGSVKTLMAALFPTKELTPLASDHSVYRSFFMIDRPVGRLATHGVVWGIQQGNMNPVLYSRDDLTGALEQDSVGRDRYPCVPGGARQRREAVKLAVNVVMYALTANYKRDQAHVRQLILEGRLE